MTTTADTVSLDALSPQGVAAQLDGLAAREAGAILASVPEGTMGQVVAALPRSRAAQLIASVSPDARDRVLAALPERLRSEIVELFVHAPGTAGALMDPRITAFRSDMTVEEALTRMRTFKETEFDSIYLMDADGRLTCTVRLGELVTASPATRLEDLSRTPGISVTAQSTRDEIVAALKGDRPAALPVVDGAGRLIGVIRHSALVSTSEAVATEGLQTMVGAGKDEKGLSPIRYAVRHRLPWLETNLATAFLAAFVVGMFEGTIAQFTALAVLLPVVAGQSGNSGMQALAVTLRALALREISPNQWPRLVVKEAGTGILNGLACAAVTMVAVWFWSQSIGLVMVIGIAMVVAMVIAGISGAIIPAALKALRQDPAQSSSIVLTTVTDVMGFLTFLGLATLFSSLL